MPKTNLRSLHCPSLTFKTYLRIYTLTWPVQFKCAIMLMPVIHAQNKLALSSLSKPNLQNLPPYINTNFGRFKVQMRHHAHASCHAQNKLALSSLSSLSSVQRILVPTSQNLKSSVAMSVPRPTFISKHITSILN
jgi:hypothetical protein